MSSKRWIANWKESDDKRAIYHCVSRVVERRFAFGPDERERFRMFMRMQEDFSGCRVLSYCVMSDHFHILLEVPPVKALVLDDEGLLKRLSAIYSEASVAEVSKEIAQARVDGNEAYVAEIYERYTYRMHDLSEFMKTLLQRFTRWFNRKYERTGTLWEDRFKSVIVQSGDASRTIAAYIDLNPVRAGIVSDPAEYHWSSYGEAISAGNKGNGKKARIGLIRACRSQIKDLENADITAQWKEASRIYRRLLGLTLWRKSRRVVAGETVPEASINIEEIMASDDNESVLPELGMAKILRMRVRYFTDGAVIGSKSFVNDVFHTARERFSENRKGGARWMRGIGRETGGALWSARALRVRI